MLYIPIWLFWNVNCRDDTEKKINPLCYIHMFIRYVTHSNANVFLTILTNNINNYLAEFLPIIIKSKTISIIIIIIFWAETQTQRHQYSHCLQSTNTNQTKSQYVTVKNFNANFAYIMFLFSWLHVTSSYLCKWQEILLLQLITDRLQCVWIKDWHHIIHVGQFLRALVIQHDEHSFILKL